MPAVDIDLGTSFSWVEHFVVCSIQCSPSIWFSCLGVWVNDRVEIITNDQGNRTTPSYVAFSDDVRLVGELANNCVALNPQNMYVIILFYYFLSRWFSSVFNAKRLIGRKFDDFEVQSDIKHFPFKVVNKSGKPYVRVTYCGKEKEFVRHV